jgi:hypothetical protein
MLDAGQPFYQEHNRKPQLLTEEARWSPGIVVSFAKIVSCSEINGLHTFPQRLICYKCPHVAAFPALDRSPRSRLSVPAGLTRRKSGPSAATYGLPTSPYTSSLANSERLQRIDDEFTFAFSEKRLFRNGAIAKSRKRLRKKSNCGSKGQHVTQKELRTVS